MLPLQHPPPPSGKSTECFFWRLLFSINLHYVLRWKQCFWDHLLAFRCHLINLNFWSFSARSFTFVLLFGLPFVTLSSVFHLWLGLCHGHYFMCYCGHHCWNQGGPKLIHRKCAQWMVNNQILELDLEFVKGQASLHHLKTRKLLTIWRLTPSLYTLVNFNHMCCTTLEFRQFLLLNHFYNHLWNHRSSPACLHTVMISWNLLKLLRNQISLPQLISHLIFS